MSEADGPIGDLLAQRRALEELALRMSGRREDADELVQEALLVALERPPRGDGDRGAWLRGVLRHLWRRRRRRAARDRTRELDAALPAASGSAGASLEGSETAARLARLVLELDEPYRTVLFLRYYEDRTPSEIAAQLGRPVNTVTSQLARGLERLRERLEPRRGERDAPWVAWLFGRRRAEPRAETSRLPAGARSVRAMAGAVACLAAVATVVWQISRPSGARSDLRVAVDVRDDSRSLAPAIPSAAREPIPPVVADPQGRWFELEIVDDEGAPVSGRSVLFKLGTATDFALFNPLTHVFAGETHDRGRVRYRLEELEDAEGGPLPWIGIILRANEPSEARYRVLREPFESCSVRLRERERSVVLEARVRDHDGRALVANVSIEFASLPEKQADGSVLVEITPIVPTDEEGFIEHLTFPPGFHNVLVHVPERPTLREWVDGAPGAVLEREFIVPPGIALQGRVIDSEGVAVPGASLTFVYGNAIVGNDGKWCDAGPDGRFRVEGLPAGPVLARATSLEDPSLCDAAWIDTRAPGREWVAQLRHPDPLRVQVTTSDGRALGGCWLRLSRDDPNDGWMDRGKADADGRVTFPNLPADETFVLEVDTTRADTEMRAPPSFTAKGILPGPEVRELVVPRERLEVGTLAGRFVGLERGLHSRMRLQLRTADGVRFHPLGVAPDGSFGSDRLGSQRYVAVLVVDGLGALPLGEFEIVAGKVHDLGEVQLPPPARVEIDLRETEAVGFELVALTDSPAVSPSMTPPAPKEWLVIAGSTLPHSMTLLPGRYRWRQMGAGTPLESRTFEIGPGEVLSLSLGSSELASDPDR